ncbi:MAG: helix-turn-helix transcriptional regulator [Lachnospiraceae bacterium]|nr:helix-turn-helix transcriptional regulator [Lachnospiraceae bacterium]MBQ2100755.1 helix-turn-helix transcriptional regulator [Lachnospiraceae bacterium]MBQ3907298.1 helix-turn-helix transcriptional regulator [Lachnospiraceae bacterium]
MNEFGNKVAQKRKDMGMTQMEFADALSVTRQTVSRWESGAVVPDVDKIGDIARILGVTCDYLLRDDIEMEQGTMAGSKVSAMLLATQGKKIKITFCEDEADIDLYDQVCTVVGFEGNWMKVSAQTKKETIEKIIPVSSIFSIEIMKEEA